MSHRALRSRPDSRSLGRYNAPPARELRGRFYTKHETELYFLLPPILMTIARCSVFCVDATPITDPLKTCWTPQKKTPEPKKAFSRPIGCMKMRPQTDE
jgi:hypothetical protein